MSDTSDTASFAHPQAMRELLSGDQIHRTIVRMAHQIIEKLDFLSSGQGAPQVERAEQPQLILLGIPAGGIVLARRLAEQITLFSGATPFVGSIDITLYRDDISSKPHRALQKTNTPPTGIDNACVILVDDVLFTGRSVRAALDALRDIGRPHKVQLAVLVDRGHRELPIRADYVGKNLPTSREESIEVLVKEIHGTDAVLIGNPNSNNQGVL